MIIEQLEIKNLELQLNTLCEYADKTIKKIAIKDQQIAEMRTLLKEQSETIQSLSKALIQSTEKVEDLESLVAWYEKHWS